MPHEFCKKQSILVEADFLNAPLSHERFYSSEEALGGVGRDVQFPFPTCKFPTTVIHGSVSKTVHEKTLVRLVAVGKDNTASARSG